MAGTIESVAGREPYMSRRERQLEEAKQLVQIGIETFVLSVSNDVITVLSNKNPSQSLRFEFDRPVGKNFDEIVSLIGNRIFDEMSPRFLTYSDLFKTIGFSILEKQNRLVILTVTFKH